MIKTGTDLAQQKQRNGQFNFIFDDSSFSWIFTIVDSSRVNLLSDVTLLLYGD